MLRMLNQLKRLLTDPNGFFSTVVRAIHGKVCSRHNRWLLKSKRIYSVFAIVKIIPNANTPMLRNPKNPV